MTTEPIRRDGNRIRASLYHNGVLIEHYWFDRIEFEQPGFYRAAVSYEYFRKREGSKIYPHPPVPPEWRTYCQALSDFGIELQVDKTYDLWKDIPQYECIDLWDFYKAVGYDYKRQRYVVADRRFPLPEKKKNES